jgi:hypothetical protein
VAIPQIVSTWRSLGGESLRFCGVYAFVSSPDGELLGPDRSHRCGVLAEPRYVLMHSAAGNGMLHSSHLHVPLKFQLSSMSAPAGSNGRLAFQDLAMTSQESSSSFEMGRLLEAASDNDSDGEGPEFRPEKTGVSPADGQPFPEGGLRAWSVVTGAFFMLLPSFGLMNSIGTFEDYWQDNQLSSYTTRDIGWIPSVFVYLGLALGIQVGYNAFAKHFFPRIDAKAFSDPCLIDMAAVSSLQWEAWDMCSCCSGSRYVENTGSFCCALDF